MGSQMIGEPRSSAQFGDDDLGFTNLSPVQIAGDVTTRFNARTGAKEYLAPTFDPFEDDDALAATVNLRSTDGARDLNGDPVTDGALLDVSLFYTDAGDRRFGLTRDGLFLNGDPVPIVLRDSRELECSARVTERVYRYDRYDNRYANQYIWMRPNYQGHRGFSYGGYGARWNGYGTTRPRVRSRSWPRVRPRSDPRSHPRPRPQSRPDAQIPYYPHSDPRIDGERQIRPRPRSDRPRYDRSRPNHPRDPRSGRRGTDLPTTTVTPNPRRVAPRTEPTTPRSTPRPERRVVTPQPAPTPRPAPAPRPRATPKRQEAPVVSRPNARLTTRERARVDHEMFPGDGYNDAVVVSSQRDCALEDQLVLFIPNDRLDAARFDGLTLILRDVTYDPRSGQTTVYDERPLYIPPNYIEGFRLATSRP